MPRSFGAQFPDAISAVDFLIKLFLYIYLLLSHTHKHRTLTNTNRKRERERESEKVRIYLSLSLSLFQPPHTSSRCCLIGLASNLPSKVPSILPDRHRSLLFQSILTYFFLFKICYPRPLFLYFRLFNSVDRKQMFIINFCQWLDLNCGPLVSEATALPTDAQLLPLYNHLLCEGKLCLTGLDLTKQVNLLSINRNVQLFSGTDKRIAYIATNEL